jgi:transposase
MAHKIHVFGIDIAKLVFQVVGMDHTGHVVLRKRLARSELLRFIATLPPLRIGMEACGSAHYGARCFLKHGYDVRLIAPQFIKAYVALMTSSGVEATRNTTLDRYCRQSPAGTPAGIGVGGSCPGRGPRVYASPTR